MKSQTLALAIAVATYVPCFALAQSVDQLLADRALLNAELDRCEQLGMASIDERGARWRDKRKTSDFSELERLTRRGRRMFSHHIQ